MGRVDRPDRDGIKKHSSQGLKFIYGKIPRTKTITGSQRIYSPNYSSNKKIVLANDLKYHGTTKGMKGFSGQNYTSLCLSQVITGCHQ